jgi:hypothetical protein
MQTVYMPILGARVTFLPDGQSGVVVDSYPLCSLIKTDSGAQFTAQNAELAPEGSKSCQDAKAFARAQPTFKPDARSEPRTLFKIENPHRRVPGDHHAVIEGERSSKPLAKAAS